MGIKLTARQAEALASAVAAWDRSVTSTYASPKAERRAAMSEINEFVRFADVEVGDVVRFTTRWRSFGQYDSYVRTGRVIRKTTKRAVVEVSNADDRFPPTTVYLDSRNWREREVVRIERSGGQQ